MLTETILSKQRINAFYENQLNRLYPFRKEVRGDKKLVFTNGCFDFLHVGHVEYLNEASSYGDILVVGINGNRSVRELKGPDRPINHELNRAAIIASLRFVDAAIIFYDMRCCLLLSMLQPDVYVKGGDYTVDSLDKNEKAVLDYIKADIKIIPIKTPISTTQILNQ